MTIQTTSVLPYKSTAAALLFSIFFGPVGLLYASFWGGFTMIVLGIIIVCSKLYFSILLLWLAGCVWSVGAVGQYNQRLLDKCG